MSAAVDRDEVFAVVVEQGPKTAREVAIAMGDGWSYSRSYRALVGLQERAQIARLGAVWFRPGGWS